jgi:hypothetical protein
MASGEYFLMSEYFLRYHYEPGLTQVYAGDITSTQEYLSPETYSRTIRHTVTSITKQVVQVDGAGHGLVISYVDTLSSFVDEQPEALPPRALIFMRLSTLGKIIESTDPTARGPLLLPQHPVYPDKQWLVVEDVPIPECSAPLSIVTSFVIKEEQGHRLLIDMKIHKIEYDSDIAPGTRHSYVGRGELVFSLKNGCIISSRSETNYVTKNSDATVKMDTVSSLTIQSVQNDSGLTPPRRRN